MKKYIEEILKSAKEGNISKLIEFHQNKVDLMVEDKIGNNPLIVALENGHIQYARNLLEYGFNVNYHSEKWSTMGDSALIQAVWLKDSDLVLELLQIGADPNHRDRTGRTALVYASDDLQLEIAELLLQFGADTFYDEYGNSHTALMYAVEHGSKEMIEILLKYKADINYQDIEYGQTLLMTACINNDIKTVKLLLNNGADPKMKDKEGKIASDYTQDELILKLLNE